MLMPMRSLSVSVDDFELCAYWLLVRLRYQTLRIQDDQVGLKRAKACLPRSLFKLLCARSLVKKRNSLEQSVSLLPHFLCRYALRQTFVHFRSQVCRLLKPKRFNFGLERRIKARQKLRCQCGSFMHGERQRLAEDGCSSHG